MIQLVKVGNVTKKVPAAIWSCAIRGNVLSSSHYVHRIMNHSPLPLDPRWSRVTTKFKHMCGVLDSSARFLIRFGRPDVLEISLADQAAEILIFKSQLVDPSSNPVDSNGSCNLCLICQIRNTTEIYRILFCILCFRCIVFVSNFDKQFSG